MYNLLLILLICIIIGFSFIAGILIGRILIKRKIEILK